MLERLLARGIEFVLTDKVKIFSGKEHVYD